MNDKLLSVQDAAKFLNVSIKTLHRWEEKGTLSPQRTDGNHRRYKLSELEAFKNKPRPAAEPDLQNPAPEPSITQAPEPSYQAPVTTSGLQINPEEIDYVHAPFQSSTKPDPINTEDIALPETPSLTNLSEPDPRFRFPTRSRLLHVFIFLLIGILFLGGVVLGLQQAKNNGTLEKIARAIFNSEKDTNVGIQATDMEDTLTGINPGRKLGFSEIAFNIPMLFTEKVTIDADTLITGNATISGSLTVDGSLTAPNILYSLVAGQNISITGNPQNPTISSLPSGVTSFQGQTGAIIITAGSGITIDENQIANSDPGSSQNIFKTFSVADQSDIKAGSNTDIFTFV